MADPDPAVTRSLEAAMEAIGGRAAGLGENGSKRGDWRQYYNTSLKDAVARRYARDLELFGYEFEEAR